MHSACSRFTLAVVQYIFLLNPDGITRNLIWHQANEDYTTIWSLSSYEIAFELPQFTIAPLTKHKTQTFLLYSILHIYVSQYLEHPNSSSIKGISPLHPRQSFEALLALM